MSEPLEPIAITGMGCVFPGAADLSAFWSNIERGVDAIGEVPPGRVDPVFFSAAADADRFYCRRGGFVDGVATFDPLAFGVMPRAASGADPDQLLALHVADRALKDAGLSGGGAWRERTGIVLGRGGYITPGLARLEQRVRTAQQLVEVLRAKAPGMTEAALQEIKAAFQEQLGPYGPDTAIGLVPNLAASRVANRLDLFGPAYTVDAACASSLIALDQACGELRSGRCDVMLAGGVHLCQDVTFWSVFTQLGALSRAGQIRPFDRRADGLLIGEGIGVVVLKRLKDAQRDGDRIYARVLSLGVSSDGKGSTLLDPRAEGQLLALERAWKTAGASPDSVGYVEAHGTGTVRGDETELTTLARFFGPAEDDARPGLGSVKSMIGHAMPAAGAAGLIRTALALHHGVLPPSLHCEEPHPLLERTRFRVLPKSEPWPTGPKPRRAAVNAFGFGGINAHVVLEAGEEPSSKKRRSASAPSTGPAESWIALSAQSLGALDQALDAGTPLADGGPYRLVLFNPTPERRAMAKKVIARERPWYGHDDLWFAPRGLVTDGGKIAFLLPGLEATFEPRVEDVAEHYGLNWKARSDLKGLEGAGFDVMSVSRLLFEALRRSKLSPQGLAGHSLGEWTGMVVSEMMPKDGVEQFITSLTPDTLQVPDVLFVAAGCSAERAAEAIQGLPEIALSHDNCPHQIILCGRASSAEAALGRLQQMQVLAQKLPFRSGFHSELFRPYLQAHRENVAGLTLQRPQVPLWSATHCAPYPESPDEVRSLVLEHLIKPVKFRELVEKMYADGFRLFVQVGAGSSLTGFVEDTLRGRPFLAVSANVKARSGMAQLRRVLAAAFCAGVEVDFAPAAPARASPGQPLDLSVPLVRLAPGVAPAGVVPLPEQGDPLLQEFNASLQKMAQAQNAVLAAFQNRTSRPPGGPESDATASGAPRPVERERERVEKRLLRIEDLPYLIDHTFYRQPPEWPDISDRYPVVPMTLLLDWLREAAQAFAGQELKVLENVMAMRWLAVAPPIEITLKLNRVESGRVAAEIEGYTRAECLAEEPHPWTLPPELEGAVVLGMTQRQLYDERWMFHGPAYQDVASVDRMSKDGVDGVLKMSGTPGALLDCAGQLFGYWIMQHTELDRMAFPVWLQRVEFFGPTPERGERLNCAVRMRELTATDARADLWLWHTDGRPYCRFTGWQDRRFDTDAGVFALLQWPEKKAIAVRRPGGYVLVQDAWKALPSRELLGRRYLRAEERRQWESVPPRQQGAWLYEQIAAKDALRLHRWSKGAGALFPAEIDLKRPEGLKLSAASVEGAGAAIIDERHPVGIDLVRTGSAREVSLSDAETRILPPGVEWNLKIWVAKRAVARSLGADPEGESQALRLERVEGERLLINGQWVQTAMDPPFIVAWSIRS